MTKRLVITFDETPPAAANRLGQQMRDRLLDIDATALVSLEKDRQDSQDFGTTLVIVLGTQAAIVLAKGIAAFLGQHPKAKISISVDGSIIATGLDSKDAAKIAATFERR